MSYMRKSVVALALATLTALAVAGCGGDDDSSGGSSSNTLTVLAWKAYGADDPWAVKEFERQSGAKVKFVYMTSEDQMLQTLQQGGVGKIDVTLPNLQYVQPAVQRGLLAARSTRRRSRRWTSSRRSSPSSLRSAPAASSTACRGCRARRR